MPKGERIGYDLLPVIIEEKVVPTAVCLAAAVERTEVPKTANSFECRCLQQTEKALHWRGC